MAGSRLALDFRLWTRLWSRHTGCGARHPEIGKAQADAGRRSLNRWLCRRHPNEFKAIAQTGAPKLRLFQRNQLSPGRP